MSNGDDVDPLFEDDDDLFGGDTSFDGGGGGGGPPPGGTGGGDDGDEDDDRVDVIGALKGWWERHGEKVVVGTLTLGGVIGIALAVLLYLMNFLILLSYSQISLATIAMIVLSIGVWRGLRYDYPGPMSYVAALGGGLASVLLYVIFWLISLLILPQVGGAVPQFLGPSPPGLLLLLAAVQLGYGFYKWGDYALRGRLGAGAGTPTWAKALMATAVIGVFGGAFFILVLGGQWANAGSLVGEAGYGLTESLGGAGGAVRTSVEAFQNTALNPRRNPNMARIVCTYQVFAGGGVFEATTGSITVSKCVQQKLGKNETKAQSERVTDPIEVQLGDAQIEPFATDDPDANELEVAVPLSNTLVQDIRGVPIRIPAENVETTVEWWYLDQKMAEKERTFGRIPNGDSRSERYTFRTFTIFNTSIRDDHIEGQIRILWENNPDASTEQANRVGNATEWFQSRFDRGGLSKDRVTFVLDAMRIANNDVSCEDHAGRLDGLCDDIPAEDTVGLYPGKEYRVAANIAYDYEAEAAFTESSRWKGGNQLLELWTEEAWRDLSPQERDSWKDQKCGEVTKYGQTFQKQRTAALTTPVVPVMYTECGIELFQGTEAGEPKTVEITGGVNIDSGSRGARYLDEENGFTIRSVENTCSDEEFGYLEGLTFTKEPGVGWTVEGGGVTSTVQRTVTVEGQRQSIGCSISMGLHINLEQSIDSSYEVPSIG